MEVGSVWLHRLPWRPVREGEWGQNSRVILVTSFPVKSRAVVGAVEFLVVLPVTAVQPEVLRNDQGEVLLQAVRFHTLTAMFLGRTSPPEKSPDQPAHLENNSTAQSLFGSPTSFSTTSWTFSGDHRCLRKQTTAFAFEHGSLLHLPQSACSWMQVVLFSSGWRRLHRLPCRPVGECQRQAQIALVSLVLAAPAKDGAVVGVVARQVRVVLHISSVQPKGRLLGLRLYGDQTGAAAAFRGAKTFRSFVDRSPTWGNSLMHLVLGKGASHRHRRASPFPHSDRHVPRPHLSTGKVKVNRLVIISRAFKLHHRVEVSRPAATSSAPVILKTVIALRFTEKLRHFAVFVGDLVNEGREVLLDGAKGCGFVPHHAEKSAVVGGADVRPFELRWPDFLRTFLFGQLNVDEANWNEIFIRFHTLTAMFLGTNLAADALTLSMKGESSSWTAPKAAALLPATRKKVLS
ncbi:hypothetical protein TYRP_023541 [Tyrophagus putrescentiae]|nr:hypothetical protein TYRP_023541 [Tyrophagus putrescentiae]